MKLMDKLKNLFIDEEDFDDEEEENFPEPSVSREKLKEKEYKESTKDVLPKVMRDTIKEEEKVELKIKPEDFIKEEPRDDVVRKIDIPLELKSEESEIHSEKKSFNEFDFDKLDYNSNVNVLNIEKKVTQKVAELYPTKEEEKVKPRFKASPVISPVYGILDKNYTKEEVKEKSEEMVEIKRPSKKVDFETVRKKAFGNLADEIKDNLLCENCELYKEVQKINALKEGDLLYDMTIDDKNDVTIEKAYGDYEEFGVAYEPQKRSVINEEPEKEIELPDGLIKYEKTETLVSYSEPEKEKIKEVIQEPETKEALIEQIAEEKKKEEEKKEKIPSREEKKKETKVDDDFFELIDSMYKERVDE